MFPPQLIFHHHITLCLALSLQWLFYTLCLAVWFLACYHKYTGICVYPCLVSGGVTVTPYLSIHNITGLSTNFRDRRGRAAAPRGSRRSSAQYKPDSQGVHISEWQILKCCLMSAIM